MRDIYYDPSLEMDEVEERELDYDGEYADTYHELDVLDMLDDE